MADHPIHEALKGLLDDVLQQVKPTQEDRNNLTLYAAGFAAAMAEAKVNPAGHAAAMKEARAFQDSISLVIARYEVKAAVAAEKALCRALNTALRLAVAALL
jgi:hypothetical protein